MMAMMRAQWLVALLLSLILTGLLPNSTYAANRPTSLVVGQIQVWEDPSNRATIVQILRQRERFANLPTTSPNYGFTASTYWLRIPVQNQQSSRSTFYFDVKSPLLSSITLHVTSGNTVRSTSQSGAEIAGRMRPYVATTHLIPFQLAAGEAAVLYVRVHSTGMPLFVPFEIITEPELQRTVLFGWLLNSAVLSILGAMALYNTFIFSLLRSRTYLYYVLHLLFRMMIVTGTGGLGAAYLYPGNKWLGNEGVLVWTGLSLGLMILFTRNFLGLANYRRFDRWAQLLVLWALSTSGISLLWPTPIMYVNMSTMIMLYPLFCLLAGIFTLRHGLIEARFFIVGQLSTWCMYILFSLMAAGIISYQPLLYHGPMFGAVADAVLLSFALADRIRILQRERVAAEELARGNLEIRREELERLVAARTAEIKILHGILPICANCKKIRNEEGAWQQLETYISQHTDAEFSHGICADCMQKLYPELHRKHQQTTTN